MSNASIAAAVLVAAAVGLLLGYFWGVHTGEKLGRDREWLESFFRKVDQDKLKRDRLGRFKTK